MIIGIIGRLGKGKTLTLTWLALLSYLRGKKILINYPVKFKHELFTSIKQIQEARNTDIFIDEIHLFNDSYNYRGKGALMTTELSVNSRRRKNNVFYATQNEMQTGARLRRITDIWVYPKFDKPSGICRLEVMDKNSEHSPVKHFRFNARSVFKLYSTREEMMHLKQRGTS